MQWPAHEHIRAEAIGKAYTAVAIMATLGIAAQSVVTTLVLLVIFDCRHCSWPMPGQLDPRRRPAIETNLITYAEFNPHFITSRLRLTATSTPAVKLGLWLASDFDGLDLDLIPCAVQLNLAKTKLAPASSFEGLLGEFDGRDCLTLVALDCYLHCLTPFRV